MTNKIDNLTPDISFAKLELDKIQELATKIFDYHKKDFEAMDEDKIKTFWR